MDVQAEAQSLLGELEKLTYTERVARMVRLGAESRQNQSVKVLISHLASKSPYEQLLSLKSCHGSRDITFAKHIIELSSSKHLKKRAIDLFALYGNDEDLVWALKSVPEYLQVATIRRLRHARGNRKRPAVIEKYLEDLEGVEENSKCVQRLFLLGSQALVEREEADNTVIPKINSVLNQWLSHEYTTSIAVEVLRHALNKINIAQLPIITLMEKCPVKAVDLILGFDHNLTKDTIENLHWRSLRNLPMSSFQPLFERYPGIVDKYELSLFRPKQRLLAYQKYRKGWRADNGRLNADILERLPTQERVAEARRHLKLRTFETKPSEKIPYIAFLPWDESIELQTPFIKSGDAQIRSAAITVQIKAVKFDETHIEDALKIVLSRKNEQDPVKNQLLSALWDIPPGRWKESHLEILDEIIPSFLKSTDVSAATLYEIIALLGRALSVHPEWAAKYMGKIMRERDSVTFRLTLFGPTPVKEIMGCIQKELSPLIEQLLRKKDIPWLVNLEYVFNDYTKHWPEYLDACEQALHLPDVDGYMCTRLLDILKKHKSGSWTRILPSVIFDNTDIASESSVAFHIHRRQQNLLDAYLKVEEKEPRERRNALKELHDGFWRWTPGQQETLT
ncbi:hypothetical protein ONS95_007541 [Cadophora gregata]|uniref:uncharacterized protein n=1 Tax=Cadophora gregata TaxID=51156 RepID=UPI0026DD0CE4|nr:uncharacterized protein ONS95_007541 [Cadophora gregata]KAK0125917.1 hypothetical protein ONS95_007541 [Cadophora gregata]